MKKLFETRRAGLAVALALCSAPVAAAAPVFGDIVHEWVVHDGSDGRQAFATRVALDADGDGIVAWRADGSEEDGTSTVGSLRFTAAGQPGEILAVTETVTYPIDIGRVDVAADAAGNAIIAWSLDNYDEDSSELWFRRLDAGGSLAGDGVKVLPPEPGVDIESLAVAMDPAGNFAIGWTLYDRDSFNETAWFQRYDRNGEPLGDIHQVGTDDSSEIQLAMNAGGELVVAWDQDGVWTARRFAADGSAIGDDAFPLMDESRVDGRLTDCVAGVADNGDVIAACAAQGEYLGDGAAEMRRAALYVARLAATGVALGDPVEVHAIEADASNDIYFIPLETVDAGGAVLAGWSLEYENDGAGTFTSEAGVVQFDDAGIQVHLLPQATCAEDDEDSTLCRWADATAFDADGDIVITNIEEDWRHDVRYVNAWRVQGPEAADLAVKIGLSTDKAAPGDTVTASLTIENLHALGSSGIPAYDGAMGATRGIAVDIALPEAFELDTKAGDWACASVAATTVRCEHFGVLGAAEELVLEADFVVPAGVEAGDHELKASVQGERADPDAANNVSQIVLTVSEAPADDDDDNTPSPAGGGGGGGALGWLVLLLAPLVRRVRGA